MSIIPDRAGNVAGWTIAELTLILLRQFKKLLAQQDVQLTDAAMRTIADQVEARAPLLAEGVAARQALPVIIQQSVDLLAGWSLTFAQSLQADMTALDHLWKTTADFLDLANEKGNAEIRISAGASLHTLLGGRDYLPYLKQTIAHDLETNKSLDVDAMIARRALLHAAQIPEDAADWWAQAAAWQPE